MWPRAFIRCESVQDSRREMQSVERGDRGKCAAGIRQESIMKRQVEILGAVACLCLYGLNPATLQAQNALGDGRVLDNNLQVGSGGANAPQQSPAYLNANDIVTGNVSGLGYFRDEVGYGSTNEFGDRLASDELFRFQAQSLPPAGPVGLGGQQSIYRSMSSYGVGQASRRPYFNAYTGGSSGQVIEQGGLLVGTGPSGDITQSSLIRQSETRLAIPQPGSTTPGDPLAVSGQRLFGASPLLGLRQYSPAGQPSDPSGPQGVSNPNQPWVTNTADRAGNEPGDVGQDQPYRLDLSVRTAVPSLELGRQIQQRVDLQRIGQPADQTRSKAAQIEAFLFDALESNMAQPGQDVYMDLLRQIKEAQQAQGLIMGEPSTTQPDQTRTLPPDQLIPRNSFPPDTPNAPDTPNGEGNSRRPRGTNATGDMQRIPTEPGWTTHRNPGLGESTDSEAAALQAQQDAAARRRARGLTPLNTAVSTDPTANGSEQNSTATPNALDQLLNTLDYDLPAVTTFVGDRKNQVNELLRQAEADLADGQYFKAEGRYQQVLRISPGYPLGRVGLIHSQMGAAMFHTAAVNLRKLFEEHPELIATRYESHLLPSRKRLDWVERELEKLLNLSEQVNTSILLAYLGYQQQESTLTQQGLNLAKQADSTDPLIALLERIWLAKQQTASGTSSSKTESGKPVPFK